MQLAAHVAVSSFLVQLASPGDGEFSWTNGQEGVDLGPIVIMTIDLIQECSDQVLAGELAGFQQSRVLVGGLLEVNRWREGCCHGGGL